MKIGIVGYGNLGRGVECALSQNPDMELQAVFTRRSPGSLKILTPNVPVVHMDDILLWKDRIEANPYFATLSVLFIALAGAWAGIGGIADWLGWGFGISLQPSIVLLLVVWALNIGESIVAAETLSIASMRALLIGGMLLVAITVGYLFSIVAVVGIVGLMGYLIVIAVIAAIKRGEEPEQK